MIDLIFFAFFVALFCAGFWCGATFTTAKQFFAAIGKKVSSIWD